MVSERAPTESRDIPLFLPFILGINFFTSIGEIETPPDRVILVNPITQGMVVIDRTSHNNNNSAPSAFESLINDIFSDKRGRPPASKASIGGMATVEITGGENREDNQCVICLEEWVGGDRAKEMPCRHRFHGECIDKWLGIHGSCPVCRYEMPVDEDRDGKRKNGDRWREIWMSFVVGRDRGNGENSESSTSDHGN